ncbi:class I SAM-dependent methyltransferase [Candidatus Pelagibacter sp.]|nr:class I SAM-dependent methyltransferase [Candidatus Pelagibacter sp.]
MNCRHCKKIINHTFLDLGFAPPSNAYLTKEKLKSPELYFPLKIKVCENCWLVQTEDYFDPKSLFTSKYAYFSSASSSWLLHAKEYSKNIIRYLNLNNKSHVIEVASNDGYLLKNFITANIPCLGIEPTKSTAIVAENLGIPVIQKFFGETLGKQINRDGKQADLIIGNNVYAHVPDINDFTKGLKAALKPGGIITLEFPHLLRLIEKSQFDTIYHEHFSYLSLYTVSRIFAAAELRVFHVEELVTHGGSLRVYGCHQNDSREKSQSVDELLKEEFTQNLQKLKTYNNFKDRVNNIKNDLLSFLIQQKRSGKKVVAYGAAAKGNTLLNYMGVKPDLISCVFDAAKAKQNQFMPGSHIPILAPDELKQNNPDFILILPWNIADEVKSQNSWAIKQGIKFITAIPKLEIS